MVSHQLQVRCRPVKVRWSPSYHQPTHPHIYKGRCSQNDSFTKSWIAYSVPQFFLEISYLNWEVMWTVKSEFLQTTHNKIAEMLAMRCLCLDSRCLTLLIITSITTNEQPTKWYLSCMTSDVKRILHEDGLYRLWSHDRRRDRNATIIIIIIISTVKKTCQINLLGGKKAVWWLGNCYHATS